MKTVITLLSGLVLASGIAFAGDKISEKSFKDVDADRDGAISLAEAASHQTLMAHFTKADANRDGKLDDQEFSAIKQEVEEAE